MKTFYLFNLKKEYISIAKKTPNNIYILFNSIKNHNKKDISSAFHLYNEICLPINNEFFNFYIYKKLNGLDEYSKFKNIHMYYNYFTDEVSKMIIYKSFIRIKSNIRENIFINSLSDINNLFICDFDNDYFKYNYKELIKKC